MWEFPSRKGAAGRGTRASSTEVPAELPCEELRRATPVPFELSAEAESCSCSSGRAGRIVIPCMADDATESHPRRLGRSWSTGGPRRKWVACFVRVSAPGEQGDVVQEIGFGQDLVRALLRQQHPDLADLPLLDVAGGWDNQQWRLGDELAVRLPRSERAPELLDQERRWLPVLAGRLPLPTPVPVRAGEPSSLFPHTWTIARWVEGEPADRVPIADPDAADVLAGFLRALHRISPPDAPVNPPRGRPLTASQSPVAAVARLEEPVDQAALREIWSTALAAPDWSGPALWLHGDLHPANVTVIGGTLAGVLDFGDLCSGDPAVDLCAAWMLLPAGAAARFFDAYQRADDATIARAKGWAILRALALIDIGRNGRRGLPGGKPTWEPAGYATLRRVAS